MVARLHQSYIEEVLPVKTNIIIFRLREDLNSDGFMEVLSEKGILAVPFGPREIRFVTHLDYDDAMLDETIGILKNISV